jgi:hypothetical protein
VNPPVHDDINPRAASVPVPKRPGGECGDFSFQSICTDHPDPRSEVEVVPRATKAALLPEREGRVAIAANTALF